MHEEKLIAHERVVTHLIEEHPIGLKLQSVAESRNEEIKNQLHEVKQNANRKRSLNLDLETEHRCVSIILSATEKTLHYALIQRQHDMELKYNGTHAVG
jgi:hypothetical protein